VLFEADEETVDTVHAASYNIPIYIIGTSKGCETRETLRKNTYSRFLNAFPGVLIIYSEMWCLCVLGMYNGKGQRDGKNSTRYPRWYEIHEIPRERRVSWHLDDLATVRHCLQELSVFCNDTPNDCSTDHNVTSILLKQKCYYNCENLCYTPQFFYHAFVCHSGK
jgi:hypothetical protein